MENKQVSGGPTKIFALSIKQKDKFLKAFNTETEDLFIQRSAIVKPFLNDMAYYSMYTNWPEMFEVIKLEAKGRVGWEHCVLRRQQILNRLQILLVKKRR